MNKVVKHGFPNVRKMFHKFVDLWKIKTEKKIEQGLGWKPQAQNKGENSEEEYVKLL